MGTANEAEIGARIATLREQRGWSQRSLAKVLGMNQSVLSRIEAGKRRVSATELEQLAAALDVDLHALLSGGPAPSATSRRRSASRLRTPGGADTQPDGSASPRLPEGPALPESPARPGMPYRSARPAPARSGLERAWRPDDAIPSDFRTVTPPEDVGGPADRSAPARFSAPDDRAESAVHERPAGHFKQVFIEGDAATRAFGAPGVEHLLQTSPLPRLRPLPPPAHTVIDDYFRLRELVEEDERLWASPLPSVDAMGRRRTANAAPWSLPAHVGVSEGRDRYARFLRHELGIGVDGPVPDLVALFEDARVAEVVVARLAGETPVAVDVLAGDVAFVFVNAARPVTLQRFALVHSVAHLVLGHGDVVDERIVWSRAEPFESEANDFAEEFLAPVLAVARWYERHGDPRPSVDVLLDLAATFGITPWAALYRSRAAERLNPKLQNRLAHELRDREWSLLPEQALRGGLRDTLSALGDEAPAPLPGAKGVGGVPAPPHLTRGPGPAAVLRLPARMSAWVFRAVREGRLSLEEAAGVLHLSLVDLAATLQRLGIE
jgi:transcriptional regulator with XRE-family HTH domain